MMYQTKVIKYSGYYPNDTPLVFIHTWMSEPLARAYITGVREMTTWSGDRVECYINGKEV